MSYEELKLENERLRNKLSPLEDKEFTQRFTKAIAGADLEQFKRDFRGGPHIVFTPKEIWRLAFGTEPNNHEVTVLGRTLQALCWERSAINGARYFVKPYEEYADERNR